MSRLSLFSLFLFAFSWTARIVFAEEQPPKERAGPRGHSGPVFFLSFADADKKFFSASRDGLVKVWDVATSKDIATFKSTGGPVAVTPDGRTLALTQKADGTNAIETELWQLPVRKRLGETLSQSKGITAIALSDDGEVLVRANGDGFVQFYDGRNGKARSAWHIKGFATSIVLTPDGTKLFVACRDQTVRIWDWPQHNETAKFDLKATFSDIPLAISSDGKTVAIVSRDPAQDKTKPVSEIRFCNVKEEALSALQLRVTGRVQGLAFSRDGRTLVTGSSDGQVRIWDVLTGKEIRTFAALKGHVLAVALSRDGKSLAASSGVWDEERGTYGAGDLKLFELPADK